MWASLDLILDTSLGQRACHLVLLASSVFAAQSHVWQCWPSCTVRAARHVPRRRGKMSLGGHFYINVYNALKSAILVSHHYC